ncbi:hypothetical protein ACFL2B_02675 [Patescibacteria group bacterium]
MQLIKKQKINELSTEDQALVEQADQGGGEAKKIMQKPPGIVFGIVLVIAMGLSVFAVIYLLLNAAWGVGDDTGILVGLFVMMGLGYLLGHLGIKRLLKHKQKKLYYLYLGQQYLLERFGDKVTIIPQKKLMYTYQLSASGHGPAQYGGGGTTRSDYIRIQDGDQEGAYSLRNQYGYQGKNLKKIINKFYQVEQPKKIEYADWEF